MSFTAPLALLLLLTIPVIVYLGWPRMRYRRWRDSAGLLLRVVIATALILALAGAQAVRSADRLGVVFLVDASDSVGQITQEAELEYIRVSLQAMGPDDLAGVVLFGSNSPTDDITVQGIFFDSVREDRDDGADMFRVSQDFIVWYEER